MAIREEKLEEVHKETEKKIEEYKREGAVQKITPKVLIIFGAFIIFFVYLIYTKKLEVKAGFLLIAGAIVLLYLLSRMNAPIGELDEQELKIMLLRKLIWKQMNTDEVPQGEIKIGLLNNRWARDGVPWEREIHFKIIRQDFLELHYSARMDPFTGNILGIVERDEGFTGKEKKNQEFIAGAALQSEKRYMEAMGKR